MKQARNTPDTPARVLAAARQLFAKQGYDGTTVRDITHVAEVNLSAVTYYYESKRLLYASVLQSVIGPLVREIEGELHFKGPPLQRIERVVRLVFRYISRNRDMPAFMVREMSADKPSGHLLTLFGRVLPAMTEVVKHGQKDGSIRAGDPTLMVLSTFAQPVYLYLTRNATKAPVDDARVVEHAVAFVRAGLEQR